MLWLQISKCYNGWIKKLILNLSIYPLSSFFLLILLSNLFWYSDPLIFGGSSVPLEKKINKQGDLIKTWRFLPALFLPNIFSVPISCNGISKRSMCIHKICMSESGWGQVEQVRRRATWGGPSRSLPLSLSHTRHFSLRYKQPEASLVLLRERLWVDGCMSSPYLHFSSQSARYFARALLARHVWVSECHLQSPDCCGRRTQKSE